MCDLSDGDLELDENLKASQYRLPHGCKVVSVTPSGESQWVRTLKIQVRLAGGESQAFFTKCAIGERGCEMMRGAFEAEKALYSVIPDHVPKPLAWGCYKSKTDHHFYLCGFENMVDDLPSPDAWARTVARLHLRSMNKAPKGKFGFHVTTYLANVPVENTWNQSWESFWTQQMKSLLEQEEKTRARDERFSVLKSALYNNVIPRLLRPLETENRIVKPCLLHSDLWPGNIKLKLNSDELCVFDSCAYWGHNEADLGVCKNPRYKLDQGYLSAYGKFIPKSEPHEDFDDRIALYALKFHVLLSILFPAESRYRQIVIDEMSTLVEKFPSGTAGRVRTKL
ncbi:hypothetical protein MMC07_000614 [Pseudocyphellaria aurata]|nr:hypothetical protein [Pseudocyphellaria aurata]